MRSKVYYAALRVVHSRETEYVGNFVSVAVFLVEFANFVFADKTKRNFQLSGGLSEVFQPRFKHFFDVTALEQTYVCKVNFHLFSPSSTISGYLTRLCLIPEKVVIIVLLMMSISFIVMSQLLNWSNARRSATIPSTIFSALVRSP